MTRILNNEVTQLCTKSFRGASLINGYLFIRSRNNQSSFYHYCGSTHWHALPKWEYDCHFLYSLRCRSNLQFHTLPTIFRVNLQDSLQLNFGLKKLQYKIYCWNQLAPQPHKLMRVKPSHALFDQLCASIVDCWSTIKSPRMRPNLKWVNVIFFDLATDQRSTGEEKSPVAPFKETRRRT